MLRSVQGRGTGGWRKRLAPPQPGPRGTLDAPVPLLSCPEAEPVFPVSVSVRSGSRSLLLPDGVTRSSSVPF